MAAVIEVLLEAVDEKVKAWHEGEGDDLSLAEFLGMDESEYDIWAANPTVWARQKARGI